MDNTFYSETTLQKIKAQNQVPTEGKDATLCSGIEQQIIKNTHSFCRDYLNMTSDECDELYHKYGSTPEGIRMKFPNYDTLKDLFAQFYTQVYGDIQMKSLLQYSHYHPSQILLQSENDNDKPESGVSSTGYTHSSSTDYVSYSMQLHDLFQTIQRKHNFPMIYLASNSPYSHVSRIIRVMGLDSFPFAGIITPDSSSSKHNKSSEEAVNELYPTKASPHLFFQELLEKHPQDEHSFTFIDDSMHNLQKAKEANIGFDSNYHIRDDYDLITALKDYIGFLDGDEEEEKYVKVTQDTYAFSEEDYLQSKNIVDANSINQETWKRVTFELSKKIKETSSETLSIVDLGAGLLSILDLMVNGFPNKDGMMENDSAMLQTLSEKHNVQEVIYYAYEPNHNLLNGCKQKLISLGFQEQKSKTSKKKQDQYLYQNIEKHITVHLIMNDFRDGSSKAIHLFKDHGKPPDLIVGCCFADLFQNPRDLISSIIELTNVDIKDDALSSTLLYFPITFAGTTLLHPPQPFGNPTDTIDTQMIPSDTIALRSYSDMLVKEHHHNLNPKLIINAAKDFGMELISSGPSDWNIDPRKHLYLWNTMRYFFRAVLGNNNKWNIKGWLKRMENTRPSIVAKNVDLLFRIDSQSMTKDERLVEDDKCVEGEEIEFVEPYRVHSVKKIFEESLGPNEIEGKSQRYVGMEVEFIYILTPLIYGSIAIDSVQSICSLISSGTELKIFRGTY